jgi:NADH-quinone oxidoreductase subunit M
MLIGILVLYFRTPVDAAGVHTFDLDAILKLALDPSIQWWVFAAFFVGFAIKVPMFPFHTWLPDAHVEAPTAGSVILAGVLLKMGTYGFYRFALPICPDATVAWLPFLLILSIIGVVYGAMVSLVQKDMKKLVAYSSVAHLGFVMLGTFALNQQGLAGSLLQQINHGISTGALFLLVGVVSDRRHTRMIADYGGIAKTMPLFAALFLIVALSSVGLPITNGFVGEFLILLGTFASNKLYGVIATSGVILAAVYLLWMYQRVFFGQIVHEANQSLKDINPREAFSIIVLIVLAIWIGVYPDPLLTRMEPSLNLVLEKFQNTDMSALIGAMK